MPGEGLREEMRDAGRSNVRARSSPSLVQTYQVCNTGKIDSDNSNG